MVNMKFLILVACFVSILHCSSTADSILPACLRGFDNVSFILYTRGIKDGITLTVENMTSIEVFRKHVLSRPLRVLLHGFGSSPNNTNYVDLTETLLEKEDVIIISINWKEGACSGGIPITELAGYYKAVENTREVGEYVANLTKHFVDRYYVKVSNIVLIGHSLGAHVAGFAGKAFQKMQSKKYPLIIGLDPANPLYGHKKCSERLCVTDADYVEIIHTTIGIGILKPIGKVDFYMNNGVQPGCGVRYPFCSHSRAVQFLTESVRHECCFIGTPLNETTSSISKCTKDSCACLGLNVRNYPVTGSLFVKTSKKPPYCNNKGKVL